MTELQIRLSIGAICLIIGIFIGYVIGKRNKGSAFKLSVLQVLAVFLFVGYQFFIPNPSDVVSIGLLTLIGGEVIGRTIADKIPGVKK